MQQTDSTTSLFSEFSSSTAAEWKAKIIKDLKEADFNSLIWQTDEGIEVQPFYTAENSPSAETAAWSINGNWQNREYIKAIDPAKVQQQIAIALQGGADAIHLDLTTTQWQAVDIAKALQGTALNQVPVTFSTTNAALLQSYIGQYHPSVSAIRGSFAFDPVAIHMQEDTSLQQGFDQLFELHKLVEESKNFTAITAGAHHYHNSGAGIVLELGLTLAHAVTYLDELSQRGAKPEALFNNMELSVSVGTNYFFEIAKLRSLRWLWFKLAEAYHIQDPAVRIHAETSQWSLTAADPYVNMLRHTTEAMSALTGGCTSLCVLPYNYALQSEGEEFAARISRNVSTILKEESYFDKTANAASGSYYLENLTVSLSEAAWKVFLQVEAQGGLVKAFANGWVQDQITKSRNKKLEALRNGSEVLVGTTKYTLPGSEKINQPASLSPGHFLNPMPAYCYL